MLPHLDYFPLALPDAGSLAGEARTLTFRYDYTDPRALGGARGTIQHHGTDLFTPEGALVVAATGGRVIAAKWSGLGGWAVMITAESPTSHATYTFLYAHMAAPPFVAEGDHVSAGAILGISGSTGGVVNAPVGARFPRGPHLHFSCTTGPSAHPVSLYPLLNAMAPASDVGHRVWPSGGVTASQHTAVAAALLAWGAVKLLVAGAQPRVSPDAACRRVAAAYTSALAVSNSAP